MIKIATFNVNSIKARLNNVKKWLKNSNCDIALLQELKCEENAFPKDEFFDLGYNCAVFGQKTYNGVAILSKFPIEDVVKTLPSFDNDLGIKNKGDSLFDDGPNHQARYIEAVIPIKDIAIRVASIYVPNGGGTLENGEKLEESQKFIYKMNFFDALKNHMKNVLHDNEIAIFGGDFNVANFDIDVYDPKSLDGTVCFHQNERTKFRSILNLGYIDSFRALNPDEQHFSWWDYRSGAWQHNKGMRIDYLLTSPMATDKLVKSEITDKGVRDQEKASDHCPVIIELDI